VISAFPAGNDLVRLDRRRFPRVQIVGEFNGRVIPFHIALRVLDISINGLAVQSSIEFTPHTEHSLQFTSVHRSRPVVRASVVHSRRVPGARGIHAHVTGLSFVHLSADARAAIEKIIADVMDMGDVSADQFALEPIDAQAGVRRDRHSY
jgi:PilZ domain